MRGGSQFHPYQKGFVSEASAQTFAQDRYQEYDMWVCIFSLDDTKQWKFIQNSKTNINHIGNL